MPIVRDQDPNALVQLKKAYGTVYFEAFKERCLKGTSG